MEEIEQALKSNNINKIKELLKAGYDVNYQNEAGNTAFHLAVENNTSSREILQLLLQHGANCKIRNSRGMTPLQCIRQDAIDTIENLLILENTFDLSDMDGNACLHTILMFRLRPYVTDTNKFWKMVTRLTRKININFNKQNKYGNTILMQASNAACLPGVSEHVQFILENINIDPCKTNIDGDNFLHILSRTIMIEANSEFMKKLLKGDFKNCSKESLKIIMSSRNKVRDTPFLKILQNTNNICNTDIIKLYIDAGSSVNDTNIRGENALHRAVLRSEGEFSYEEENYAENILCLAKAGADVNAEDMTSSTPIMLVSEADTITALIDAGASVNRPNKLGQAPIVVHLLEEEINLDAINVLIQNGADVNAVDNNKNSLLHYYAWGNFDEDELLPFLNAFLKAGAKPMNDALEQLPCHVAYYRRNRPVFEMLCKCAPNTHIEIEKNFTLNYSYKDIDTLASLDINDLEERFKPFRYQLKSDLLNLANLGHVSFINEAEEIKVFVHSLMERIRDIFVQKNNFFDLCILESGSAGENTKVQDPNEFDFVCILQRFSEICEVNEDLSSSNPGFAYLKLKDEIKLKNCDPVILEYFDSGFNFDTFLVWQKCQLLLQEILHSGNLFTHPNVVIKTEHRTPTDTILTPTTKIKFYWSGPFYKSLEVKIDVVLACQIKGWWPEGVKLEYLPDDIKQKIEKEGCLLILQTQNEKHKNQLRISAINAEKAFMKWLPNIVRDSYVVCKIMCDNRICPSVKNEERTFKCREYITSYEIKTCAFHVFRDFLENKSMQFLDDYKETDLYEFVCNIFKELKHAVIQNHLQSFLFPWQNVFTFLSPFAGAWGMEVEGIEDDEIFFHVNCSLKKLFLVTILQILGVNQDQNEIDIDRIKSHWKEMKDIGETFQMENYWDITEQLLAEIDENEAGVQEFS